MCNEDGTVPTETKKGGKNKTAEEGSKGQFLDMLALNCLLGYHVVLIIRQVDI